MNKSKFTKTRKAALALLCALSVTCTGLAAACAPTRNPDDEGVNSSPKEDTQLLKNGNFEFANVPEKGVYLIKNVDNWSRSGDTSGTKSGIINTSESAWEKMTDSGLKTALDDNNALQTSNPDYDDLYVDYNGMKSADIVYADPYLAALEADKIGDDEDTGYAKDSIIRGGGKQQPRTYKEYLGVVDDGDGFKWNGQTVYFDEDSKDYYFDKDFTESVRFATIENPETHYGSYNAETQMLGDKKVYLDDDGNYFFDEDKENDPTGNVLMVHNYPNNTKYNGIEQHYASQTITLEANTAAEISLWVKTSDLKFDKGYSQLDDQNRGAYIEVTQTVGSSSIDSFKIKAINTEKIIGDNADLGENESNGWLKYTVYVNACDFASSNITINLGLGDTDVENKVTGYAFFDDVQVTKYIDLGDEGCTYTANKDELKVGEANSSYCSLASEEDEKIFYADKLVDGDARFSTRFFYFVDLASETYGTAESAKKPVSFQDAKLKTTASLTYEESGKDTYASSESNSAKITGFTANDLFASYTLPDGLKDEGGVITFNDLVGIFGKDKTAFTDDDFNSFMTSGNVPYVSLGGRLTEELLGKDGSKGISALDGFGSVSDMIVIFSAYGAAYTAKIENADAAASDNLFSVPAKTTDDSEHYSIVSFWVKTADLEGNPAATIKLIDADDDKVSATVSVDTTNVTTDVGDKENIYSDWVQCFFFVENDTENVKNFTMEFSFGNTGIESTSATSYHRGWAAIGNVQVMNVDKDIFDLVSTGTYAQKLTFSKEDEKTSNSLTSPTETSDVKKGIATPNDYTGVNGAGNAVTGQTYGDEYDKSNNHKGIAGLVNREYFEKYDSDLQSNILGSFISGASHWNDVFGEYCYQPLIIVDSLRTYHDRMHATEETFKDYYILDADGVYKKVSELPEEEQVFDENLTYYSAERLVKNYGFIGAERNISGDTYTTVSVRVMVSGDAKAYVYLVDTDSDEVMTMEAPAYSFYYDEDGNVLSEEFDEDWSASEHREKIIYSIRDDGLYEDKDGKLFANLHNIEKRFKDYRFEHNDFYEKKEGGNVKVKYAELKDGVTYYSDEACTKIAPHYLCVGNQKIYRYDAETAKYYYLKTADGNEVEVANFDEQYARYSNVSVPEYMVEIGNTEGQWVTVNFIIHTGSDEKNYRLELWSGKRDETGADGLTSESTVNGAVAFDYSNFNVSTDSNYNDLIGNYEQQIIDVYKKLIRAKDTDSTVLTYELDNIAECEAALEKLGVTEAERKQYLEDEGVYSDYVAEYYKFNLYDSAKFVPFNRETADAGQSGYDYHPENYTESLIYFSTYDKDLKSYNRFINYSAVDQTVSMGTIDASDDNDSSTDTTTNNNSEGWLLITSIIFAVVMIFALLAVLVRFLWKKLSRHRAEKDMQKNKYKKRDRYIRKLGLVKNVPEEEESTETPAGDKTDGND